MTADNKKLSLILCATLLGAVSAKSQTIKGVVTDKDGQLPGATVMAPVSKQGSSTDLNGGFTLNTQVTGKVKILVSYIGHDTKELELDIKKGVNDLGTIKLEASKQLNEVLVKGTMVPSQMKALSIKKNSLAIMDVIAADAIGKLPDRNAAEAVQRVQGVAVARYHGEADAATVRGTPFAWTSILFNGSRLPSANVLGSRNAVLDAVPSEMIQYVQVAKAITPDMEGDAVGGSINFITRTSPAKRVLNVSAAGGYNTFSKDGTYNGSIVYGDRFFKGKLGVMLAGAVWNRQWGTDAFEVAYNTGLADPQQKKSIATTLLKRYMGQRQTYGGNLGLDYTFNKSNKIYLRGLMDKFNDIRPVYESYVDYNNSQYQYNYRYSYYQTVLNGAELGGEHQLSSRLKMDWAVSDYYTKYFLETPPTNGVKGLPIATFKQKITGGFSNLSSDGKRYWGFDSPNGVGGNPLSFDPGLKNSAETMDATKLTLQQLVIAQLDTKEEDKTGQINFKFNASSRVNLKAGFKYRHKDRSGMYGSNAVYLAGAALGIPQSPALVPLSNMDRTDFPMRGGFFNGMKGNYDAFAIDPITKGQLFNLFDTATLRKNGFMDFTSKTNPTNIYEGTENVAAGYAMAEIDATDKLKVIAGVRNEYTTFTLHGTKATTAGSPAVTTLSPVTVSNNYNALLPMVHLKYSLNDHANIRAAYTKSFVRPNFSDLTPGESMDNTKNPIAITKGNVDLKPTFANNFDLMGEYYFKNVGLISGGVFYKKIKNVIFTNSYTYQQEGTNYMLTQAQNISDAWLVGMEAGINKRLDFLPGFFSGLGVEFNYTFINSEVKPTGTYTSMLPNQSKNLFNSILFYERKGVMVRVAGNYRGASVETINTALGPDFFTWTDKNFTVDASATVSITPSIRVFVELNNLTNEPLRVYMGDHRRITSQEWYGSKGQAGIKWDIIK
ncbi:TonB-dependent receptor [Chitinophaga sp. Cy-1792]|uniref:TonB-dependent receptor n=1 Tax=Chitinophaga sp. Cy-1792 TaxID=2608339 RepID=UPI0014239FAD|nr:TonB-dependent receptor [Chitinophaga sp. Cy-1792]NIG56840.1 TonB-dependent receptor [Chitinophaga sp. Cy-1792]